MDKSEVVQKYGDWWISQRLYKNTRVDGYVRGCTKVVSSKTDG